MIDPASKESRAEVPAGVPGGNFIRRHSRWAGLLVVAVVFAAVAALSWRRWPEVLADFGVQLYVPWRLTEGSVLYRDLFYISGGPFSQYFNALLFRIFGVSFLTLIMANLIIVAAMVWLIYHRFRAASETWVATMICLGVVLVFAFGQYSGSASAGDWNYVVPYCHDALHGLALSILGVALLSDWVSKGGFRYVCAAGFCAGLVFLTKPDIFAALTACVIVAFAWVARRGVRFAAGALAGFLLAAMLPSAFFFLYFLGKEGWRESLRSVIFGWVPLFNAAVVNNSLNQWCLGFDQPAVHLRVMLFQFAAVAGLTMFYAFVFRHVASPKPVAGRWERNLLLVLAPPLLWQRIVLLVLVPPVLILVYMRHWLRLGESLSHLSSSFGALLAWSYVLTVVFMALFQAALLSLKKNREGTRWFDLLVLMSPLLVLAGLFDWIDCGASLPLLSLSACIMTGWNFRKPPAAPAAAFPFLWSVFGLVLLSKMGVFPRIWHYGFVLAMPAFVSAVYLFLWMLPALLEKKWAVPARLFRATALLVLMIGFASLFWASWKSYHSQNLVLSSGKDKILTFGPSVNPGESVRATLSWIEKNTPPNATLAVLPEGITINYLTRRINPTPCLLWDENVVPVYGSSNITAAFQKYAPDYVVLIERDPSDPGFSRFGDVPGFGGLMRWVDENYQLLQLFGDEPVSKGAMDIKILKRRLPAIGARES
jgi:hypothetical protein